MKHDAGVTFITGRRGSGKTTWLTNALKTEGRVIVFSPIERDFRKGFDQVSDLRGLTAVLRRKWGRGFRVKYTPPETDAGMVKALHELTLLVRALQEPYAQDRDRRQITIAVDEANQAFPHHRPPGMDGFRWALLQGRNWGINIYAATQRPTLVHPDLRDNAERLIVFALMGDNALQAVTAAVGREHTDAIRKLENHQYIAFENGRATRGTNKL